MREFSFLAVILGVLLAVLFGAANAYIGLKVGMTVSASIPAAVISMAVLRGILKRGTLLENNMVQTIGSSGEGLAAGMIFTIPALYMLGKNNPNLIPEFSEMVLWGTLGGLLGVFCMIPLRRLLIVKEHGVLPFPEGVACAEVLQAGERGGTSAKPVFMGVIIGGIYELFRGLGFWREVARQGVPVAHSALRLSVEPALLGVGYILGIRIASYMLAGALLGWFVLIPCIAHFGQGAAGPIFPSSTAISDMTPELIHKHYIRYIGAGAVVLGGLFSLIKSLKTVAGSFAHLAGRGAGATKGVERTDRDIPLPLLLLGVLGLAVAIWYSTQQQVADPKAVWVIVACTLVFGVFFVTVSSRLVGIVGSSSNPASGMTIATLLATALVLVYGFGMTGPAAKGAIIAVGAIVCIAVCLAGDCSQDLKTGFLVKATPWKQQLGEVVGVLAPVAAIAGIIMLLNNTYGFTDDRPHPLQAPQANVMKLLADGVVDGNLPWILIIAGLAIGAVIELLGMPALPFAIGLYLPLELSTPIMVGALIKWVVQKFRGAAPESEDAGVLGASGLVAGQGLVGVGFACSAALIGWWWHDPMIFGHRAAAPEQVMPRHAQEWVADSMGFDPLYGLEQFNIEAPVSLAEEQRQFDVVLSHVGPKRDAVVQLIRQARPDLYHANVTLTAAGPRTDDVAAAIQTLRDDMTLAEIQRGISSLPFEVLHLANGEKTTQAKSTLEEAGGTVSSTTMDRVDEFLSSIPAVVVGGASKTSASQWAERFSQAGASAEVKTYIVDWNDLLPLFPFGLLMLWLGIVACKGIKPPPFTPPTLRPGPARVPVNIPAIPLAPPSGGTTGPRDASPGANPRTDQHWGPGNKPE